MSFVSPKNWLPKGVDSLEPTADVVVRSDKNTLVVAGPGAGKTELLAQRACFLLDTGTCPAPRRILAISFKRDAAKNLDDRVIKRCGDRAQRFDSYTLDAFAKGLVDRFRLALPDEWRPKLGYEVRLKPMRADEIRDWLKKARFPESDLYQKDNNQIQRCFDQLTHGQLLPYSNIDIDRTIRHLGLRWWREQLDRPEGQPSLSFPMLSRLAAFLLRINPKLAKALRATYSYVFLDEFQDTTAAQYDLIRAAFQDSTAVLTAVGDGKQRIMVYAGAMPDVFETYAAEFGAERHYLASNYRSVPELVRMQHVIAQAVESGTPAATATKVDSSGGCVLLEFSNPEDEAEHLATLIERGIGGEARQPRDFCIIARQHTDRMIRHLKATLSSRGIKLRDESQLQDLLAEPVVEFLLAILRLATRPRDSEAWVTLTSEIAVLFGLDENDDISRIEHESKRLFHHAREALNAGQAINTLPPELVSMVGHAVFRAVYRQYGNGAYLEEMVDGLAEALQKSANISASAHEAVNDVIGLDVVPALTIHKSKGLEFNTVIFLGLEDSQWWAFSNQAEEEKRAFFVAFSRAIERVYFTFSDVREERNGRRQQRRAQIGDLYTILQQAGVATVNHRRQVV